MKRNWLLCAVIGLAASVGLVAAQEDAPKAAPKKAKKERPAREKKAAPPKSLLSGQYAAMAKALNLSKEQEEKIAAVLKAEKDKMAELAKSQEAKNKELAEKAKGLNDQLSELRKQQQEMSAARAKISAERDSEIQAVLTDQQKQDWKVDSVLQRAAGRAGKLNDEQMAKAKALVAEEIKKQEAAGKPITDRQFQEAVGKAIMANVLTDTDRKAMALAALTGSAMRSLRGVKLTAEQDAKVKTLAEAAIADLQATQAKAAEMTKELDALKAKEKAASENLGKQIEEQVLTAEQKAKMKEAAEKAKAPREKKAKKTD